MAQVRVVCTDKGTHPSRELALLTYTGDPPVVDFVRRQGRKREGKLEFGYATSGNESLVDLGAIDDPRGALWRFVCPTCRRDVPLRDDRLGRLLAGVVAAGRVSVDLSKLPANLR